MTTQARKIASTIDALRVLRYSREQILSRLQAALTGCVADIDMETLHSHPGDTRAGQRINNLIQQRDALQAAIAEL